MVGTSLIPVKGSPARKDDKARGESRGEVARPKAAIDKAAHASSYEELLQKAYGSRVDVVDKKLGMHSSLTKLPTLSTGLLSVDLVLGKGLSSGFSVFLGAEASAKSTACMTTLYSSLKRDIPVRKYFDAEGAVDRKYTGGILQTDSWGDVFGDRGKNGWIKRPRCTYSESNIIETVFRDMHRVASFMPDKAFREDLNQWFLVFDRTTDQRHMMADLVKNGACGEPDKSLFKSTANYWCPVEDDAPQAVFFVDSLPSLVPEKIDEETMSDGGLAIDARFLGKYLKIVRGKLRPKGIVLLAVNQIRSRPMAGPGELDWYEPAGNAVKFASDTRTMWTSRVPPMDFPRWADNRGLCSEPSVEFDGAHDLYAFKGITNIKNKLGTPFRKSWSRVWIKDGRGVARGFDPAFDTYNFLVDLGVVSGPITEVGRKKFRIDLKPIRDVDWTWRSFKSLVVGEHQGNRRLVKQALDLGAPNFKLRDYCERLMAANKTDEMLSAAAIRREKTPSLVNLEADPDAE